MTAFALGVGAGDVVEGEAGVDHRSDLSGLDPLLELDQLVGPGPDLHRQGPLAVAEDSGEPGGPHGDKKSERGHQPDVTALPRQHAGDLQERPVGDRVQDQIPDLLPPGEVLLDVVDHLVCAELAQHLEVSPARHPRDPSAEAPRDLDRKGPHAPGRAVDQHPHSGGEATVVPESLERGEPGQRHRGGLLEGEVIRHRGGVVLGDHGELGACATGRRRQPGIDDVAGAEAPYGRPDLQHLAGEIGARDHGEGGAEEGAVRALTDLPVHRIDRRRPHLNQDLILRRPRRLDLPDLQHLRSAVARVHRGLHGA